MNRHFRRFRDLFDGVLVALLCYFLLAYGLGKVLSRQFFVRLPWHDEPTAHLDGFQLAWTYHAFSRRYEMALGLVEVICALLLLIPRTRTIGALLTTAVMANIVLLNVEYDIGALIPSVPMLVIAATIALLRWRRVVGLVIDRPVPLEESATWPRWALWTGRVALLAAFGYSVVTTYKEAQFVNQFFAPSAVYGRYRVATAEPAAARPDVLSSGDIIYFDRAGSAGLRREGDLFMGRYKFKNADGILEATFYRAGFEYFHEQHRTGDASTRLFVPENVLLTLKGEFRRDNDRLIWTMTEPAGLVIDLIAEKNDWPAVHRDED